MKIKTTKTELTMQDIATICLRIDSGSRRIQHLMRYYKGDMDVMQKQARENSKINNKVVANFCKYISNMSTGFFIGKPVAYSSISKNVEEVTALTNVFRYNDEEYHNLMLAESASITGTGYEVLYMDEDANIRFECLPPDEVMLVCDASLEENVLYAIRKYRVYDIAGSTYQDYVDVYDADSLNGYRYSEGQLEHISGPDAHYFDGVPVIEYPNNKECEGDFEGIISMNDAYNKAQSLTMDDMEDFTDAFLLLKGMGGCTSDDVQKLRKSKVIPLDEGGGAEWLIKNLNDTYIENIKSRLQRDIHKFSSVPDMSDENFAGNASGVAIKYKLIGLELIRSRKERGFKKGLQHRIELIAGMLKMKNVADVDFRDISITFTANIPADVKSQADMVKELYGLVSQKTLLSLLPFITDPKAEMDELKQEEDARIGGGYNDGNERGVLVSPDDGTGTQME